MLHRQEIHRDASEEPCTVRTDGIQGLMPARIGELGNRISVAFASHRGKIFDVASVAGSRLVRQGVLLIAMAVAARTLSIALLGVWALIYIVIQFGVMLSDAGISTFVVREKDLTDRLYSTAFYACVLLSIAVTTVTAAITAPLSAVMGYPGFKTYFVIASIAIIPAGINAVLQAHLRRQRRFGVILATDAMANGLLLSGIVGMLLAGFGLWSFVVPTILASTFGCTACACVDGIPVFKMDRTSLKRVADYSLGLVGFSTVNFWARNADHVLIGRILGAAPLGIYSVAYRMMMLPLSQITSIAITVALPYMAPHQDDHERLRLLIRRLLVVIGALTTAPITFVWLQRYFLVDLLLGTGWARVGDLLTVLLPLSLFQVFVNPLGLCFQISGRTRQFFVIGVFNTLVLLTGFVIGVWLGTVDDVVNAYACAVLVASPVGVHYGLIAIGSGLKDWCVWCIPYFLCLPACWLVHHTFGVTDGTADGVTTDALLSLAAGAVAAYATTRAAWQRSNRDAQPWQGLSGLTTDDA